jgi:predicted metalloprotease with PDZ domain
MKKIILCFIASFLCIITNSQNIRYLFSFPNAVHHEANIQLVARDIPKGPAIFKMSRSSPGRYAAHEFGKNIHNVKAFDKTGTPIAIEKMEGDVYRVPKHNGFVNVTYTIYANHPDGTYAGIDEKSIHLNMPAVFMWMKGMEKAPIELFFDLPEGEWKIATQLKPTRYNHTFTAPHLQYFMDSPTKLGELQFIEWNASNPDQKTYQFRLALEAKTNDSTASAFAEKIKNIVLEAQAVYGEFPNYDFQQYTFIASINPWVNGDGMEHRNSTMITIPVNFDGNNSLLEVFAHEFFHCWNVERIRPKSLEPFNFEKSNMSGELWFAEGFTQYYGDLLTRRSGYSTPEEFFAALTSYIYSKAVVPGGKNQSPVENSQRAVFVDAGVAVDKTNYPNTFSSYYPLGAAVALALELELRIKFNKTLDDYMKAAWNQFGKTEIAYTIPGLQQVLEKLTDKSFASDFFQKYVNGHEPYDYNTSLEYAGLTLKKNNEGKAWMGNPRFGEQGRVLTINSNTIIGSPFYAAGLDIGDQIISIDAKPVKNAKEFNDVLQQHKPGDQVEIIYKHREVEKRAMVTLMENPSFSVAAVESAGRNLSEQQKAFRKSWLESKLR